MTASNPFHLAIPVSDLDVALAFYEKHLGCCRGRESQDWVDLNFFGHQLSAHIKPDELANAKTNEVNAVKKQVNKSRIDALKQFVHDWTQKNRCYKTYQNHR